MLKQLLTVTVWAMAVLFVVGTFLAFTSGAQAQSKPASRLVAR